MYLIYFHYHLFGDLFIGDTPYPTPVPTRIPREFYFLEDKKEYLVLNVVIYIVDGGFGFDFYKNVKNFGGLLLRQPFGSEPHTPRPPAPQSREFDKLEGVFNVYGNGSDTFEFLENIFNLLFEGSTNGM